MAKCYSGEMLYGKLLHGEMLLRRVVIWRNVIWRDVTELIPGMLGKKVEQV